MLNQSFTADNFEKIYDIENRKSSITVYLGEEYKEVLAKIKSLQNEVSQIKRKKFSYRSEAENQALIGNKQNINKFIANKKEIQLNELEKISKLVNNKGFKFHLDPKDDDIFVIQNTKDAFFAIKQLQYNVKKTFKVKQSSRHLILSQIKLLLNESSPKYVIRTDVSKFFESILQDKLFDKINENTLLNIQSKKFIQQILDEYNTKKDTTKIDIDKGVPRGVGISSYLSELYMKDIDNQIKNMEDVVYYARYVDDIFVVISPKLPKKSVDNYFARIKQIVGHESLTLKDKGDNKCSLLDLSVPNMAETKITYLGYTLYIKRQVNKTNVNFGLSEAKKDKIKNRIKLSFNHFNDTNKYGLKNSRNELLLTLRFLSSNTKLSGAKSRVKTGIFFSNDLLDNDYFKDIEEFDEFLRTQKVSFYDKFFQNQEQKLSCENRLKAFIDRNIVFKKGFKNKIYHTFSKDELRTIKRILQ